MKQIKITELLNPKKFEKHREQLETYFKKGGTWQELLGYDDSFLNMQYHKAYDFYQRSEYQNAAALFSYLTMINPYNYNFWMGLGMSKQSDRHYEEAIVSYTAAEAMDENNPTPHLLLAQCFHALQVSDLTLEHLKKAVTIAGERIEFKEVRQKAQNILNHLSFG